MGGWGSRVLNLWKCENTRFLRNFWVGVKSPKLDISAMWVLNWSGRWVGGVRCLGLFPKKIDCFYPFPNWKSDLCRRTSCGNGPGEKKRDSTVLEDCLCLHIEGLWYRIRKLISMNSNLIWFLPSAPIRHPCGKWKEVFCSSCHQLPSSSLSQSHFFLSSVDVLQVSLSLSFLEDRHQ